MNKSCEGVTRSWTCKHFSMRVCNHVSMSAYKYVSIQEYEHLRTQVHIQIFDFFFFRLFNIRNQGCLHKLCSNTLKMISCWLENYLPSIFNYLRHSRKRGTQKEWEQVAHMVLQKKNYVMSILYEIIGKIRQFL